MNSPYIAKTLWDNAVVETTDISSPATQARPERTIPVYFSFVCSKTDMFI